MSDKNVSHEFSDFFANLHDRDLADELIHDGLRVTIDTITCAIAGQAVMSPQIVNNALIPTDGGTCSVIGDVRTAGPVAAAFANANSANALDLDDNLLYHSHIANTVVGAAVAAAEQRNASGRELLASVAIGYEAAARVSLSMPGTPVLEPSGDRLVFPNPFSHSYNTIGAAVAVAKVYGLPVLEMRNAIGLAVYASPVPSVTKASALPRLPMSKFGHYGWQAASGMLAGLLAAEGYTGDTAPFDGDLNYAKMLSVTGFDGESMVRDLGTHWWLPWTSYKLLPAGTWMRPALRALDPLVQDSAFSPESISKIQIYTRPLAEGHSVNVFEAADPESYLDLQVSYKALVAAYALKFPPQDWCLPQTYGHPKLKDMIERIELLPYQPATDAIIRDLQEFPYRARGCPTRVIVEMADGTVFEHEASLGDGDPFDPETHITDDKLRTKFNTYAAPRLQESEQSRVQEALWGLEDAPSARAVMETLRAGLRPPSL